MRVTRVGELSETNVSGKAAETQKVGQADIKSSPRKKSTQTLTMEDTEQCVEGTLPCAGHRVSTE